jgi:hypothetical protein
MTLAVAAPTSTQQIASETVPIVVLGTDAILAANPATPVQLAHACLRAGFANVVPASWGDELLAAAVLRRLPAYGNGPVIQCSCPIVAHRLLTVGGDLRPMMLALVPPPVAVARYIRKLSQPTRTRITYVGGCPGSIDDSIDIRMTPDALIAMLAERDIVLEDQPRIFESVIPPDRRRFRSQPGGVPAAEVLWAESGSRTLVEVDGDEFAAEIAQYLLSGKNILIDASPRLGCVCSGATAGSPARHARAQVVALEPPRATIPIVDEQAPIELDLAVPAAPRAPIDVVAVPPGPPRSASNGSQRGLDASSLGHRISPVRGFAPVADPRQARVSNPGMPAPPVRPVVGPVPVARDPEGKSLPRAYVARRRPSPRATPTVRPAATETARAAAIETARSSIPQLPTVQPKAVEVPSSRIELEIPFEMPADPVDVADPGVTPGQESYDHPFQNIPLHYVVLILVAVAVTIVASSAIAIVAGRSLNRPPAATQTATP